MSSQNNNTRNIDPEKVTAERLNGYAALLGSVIDNGSLGLIAIRIVYTLKINKKLTLSELFCFTRNISNINALQIYRNIPFD